MSRFLSSLLAVAVVFPQAATAETLKLRAGPDLEAAVTGLEGGQLILKDGRKLPREQVEEILFAQKSVASGPAVEVTDKDRQRAKELFAQARDFGKKYPGMDGLILLDQGEYALKEDGTWVYRYHFAGQVLKERMKQDWGTVMDYYEDGRSRAQIVTANVYRPDGTVFPLDRSKIADVRPQAGDLFFTSERYLSYALPQVEVGSIVEYVTEHDEYNPFRKDFFFPAFSFQSFHPTMLSSLRITVPKAQPLYYDVRNFQGRKAAGKPKVSSDAKTTTYAWRLEDVEPLIPEPEMVQPGDVIPSVKAALFKDWQPILSWLKRLYEERTVANEKLAAFTRELIKDCKTDDERVAAIYHYLQKNIRYIAVKMGVASGWGGYDANLTWERHYGCCIDKALLFTAMLKVAGVWSTPLIIDTNYAPEHDWNIPDIGFEHAISMVKVGPRRLVLDSTGSDYRYPYFADMDHGVGALDIFEDKVDRIETPPPADNSSKYTYLVTLGPKGDAVVDFSTRYTGPREAQLRGYYKSRKEAELKEMFQSWINEISPGAKLLDYKLNNLDEVSQPFSFTLRYELADYPVRAGDLAILKLPEFQQSFGETALDKRKYDIEYQTSMEKSFHYEIRLPENFSAAYLLEPIDLKGRHGSFKAGCREEGRTIVCETDFQRASRVIPVKDYAEYKDFLRRVSRYTENRVFLKDASATAQKTGGER